MVFEVVVKILVQMLVVVLGFALNFGFGISCLSKAFDARLLLAIVVTS